MKAVAQTKDIQTQMAPSAPWAGKGMKLNGQSRFVLSLLLLSLLSYFLVSRYIMTAVVVQGRSMAPTLQDGGCYLLNHFAFWFREPLRGDLVVIRDLVHNDLAVKRIVALPGEMIEIREGEVLINSQLLDEPYLANRMCTYSPRGHVIKLKLPQEMYFVMGDNRSSSEDSRAYGPLERERIIGLLMK